MYAYTAIVRKIHDGDTITVDVDLGFTFWAHTQQLRLLGIQAPELDTEAGVASQAYLAKLLPLGVVVEIHTVKDKREKYGRMLADVFAGEVHVNKLLIDEGYAVGWDGKGTRPRGF